MNYDISIIYNFYSWLINIIEEICEILNLYC